MKKRILATLMALVLTLGLLAGCGEKADPTDAPKTTDAPKATDADKATDAPTEAPTEPAEPVELVWLSAYGSNVPVENDTYAEKLIEERCNVNITPVTDVTQENMAMFIASEGILDVTVFTTYLIGSDLSTMVDMYDQELIREIPEEYLWEYYPTGMQLLVDFLGEDYFDEGKHLIDGKLLNIPYVGFSRSAKHGIMYRLDWAEKLGIKEPTSLEEYHDMLYAFTYSDPDGNGVDDTYGLSCYKNGGSSWAPIFGSFGFYNYKLFTDVGDGEVVYWGATDNYRQALTLLKEWYDEGIVDPEMITDDRDALRAKWASGRIGSMSDTHTWITRQKATGVGMMIVEAYGKDALGIIGQMTSPYGDGIVYMAEKDFVTHTNSGLVFTANATDEQIIAVLKMQEAFASDPDFYEAVISGEKGVEFDVVDGTKVNLVNQDVAYQASRGLAQYYCCSVEPAGMDGRYKESEESKYWSDLGDKICTVEQGGIVQASNITVISEVADQYKSEVNKVADEYFSDVLLGKTTLSDADWEAYLAELNAAGLDKIIADYESLLK